MEKERILNHPLLFILQIDKLFYILEISAIIKNTQYFYSVKMDFFNFLVGKVLFISLYNYKGYESMHIQQRFLLLMKVENIDQFQI